MANTLVYLLDNKIYINLTNRCTNNCIFCLRNDRDDVCGQKLWLDSEDFEADDVIKQFENVLQKAGSSFKNEAVFCGYGEPMLKLDILKKVAEYIWQFCDVDSQILMIQDLSHPPFYKVVERSFKKSEFLDISRMSLKCYRKE